MQILFQAINEVGKKEDQQIACTTIKATPVRSFDETAAMHAYSCFVF